MFVLKVGLLVVLPVKCVSFHFRSCCSDDWSVVGPIRGRGRGSGRGRRQFNNNGRGGGSRGGRGNRDGRSRKYWNKRDSRQTQSNDAIRGMPGYNPTDAGRPKLQVSSRALQALSRNPADSVNTSGAASGMDTTPAPNADSGGTH